MQGRRVDFSWREGLRLPPIASRNDLGPLSPTSRHFLPAFATLRSSTTRTRLPPRSKKGCWTCRNRKVKCDELKPICTQCSRLSLECKYEQRIAFRDDNQKVFDKEPNVIAASSPVWNPDLYIPPSPGREHFRRDSLPPFTALTTDEDRERKSELYKPGTFLLVIDPSNFASLSGYQSRQCTSPIEKLYHAPTGSKPRRRRAKRLKVEVKDEPSSDSNILLLDAFEELSEHSLISPVLGAGSQSTVAASYSSSLSDNRGKSYLLASEALLAPSKLDQARRGGQDAHLLEHYRSNISRYIIKIGSQDVDEDVFELEARTCPPLFHAMMAISALSLAHRAGSHKAEALEHYQQVLPAMRDFVRSEEDSNSDGALFTHYLLLLYDIASAGPWESNMWQSHSNALQKIIARRRQVNRTESHGFLVWIICLVDTYALLSGSGDGVFTNFILKNNMLSPGDCLPPLGPGRVQTLFQEELPFFPRVSELLQEVLDLAVRVGGAARDLRGAGAEPQNARSNILGREHPFIEVKRRRVREIQDLCLSLYTTWQARYPEHWPLQPSPKSLPPRVRGFCDHIYALYRACIIYSYTSMYLGQMGEMMTDEERQEVSARVTELIQLAKLVVAEERWDLQYIPFCLFLAGAASEDKGEKAFALKLLRDVERQGHGANTTAMRRLLRAIYDKQEMVAVSGAQHFRIDWVDEMRSRGLMLVMFSV